ncbi:hypothetical protein ACEQ8H_004589 [Pleosporales sp. CAS-2024a]
MSFLGRPASLVRSAASRPGLSPWPRAFFQQVRFATQDYGSGAGHPAGETPQQQGQNPSEHMEHPGPPPPKVARGKSSSSPNQDSAGSQQDVESTGPSDSPGSKKGAQPKILDAKPPGKEEQGDEVKKHNEDMERRRDSSKP